MEYYVQSTCMIPMVAVLTIHICLLFLTGRGGQDCYHLSGEKQFFGIRRFP